MITTEGESQEDDSSSSLDDGTSSDKTPGEGQAGPSLKEGPSGIKVEGDWEEVTAACTDLTDKLEQTCPAQIPKEDKRFKEWVDWYPREQDGEQELGEKTAEQAKFKADQTPKEHLKEGSSQFSSFRKHLRETNLTQSLIRLSKASQKWLAAAASFLAEFIGQIEGFLYRRVVTRTNPYYFDNSLISASFRKTNRFHKSAHGQRYQLTIKVHDPEVKDDFQELVLSEN
ncbi:MAG: DUF5828 family protein [Candidatus Bipolaricaulota bacterium]